MFFQANADAPFWGPPSWGHVVSEDLVRWRRLPTALVPRVGEPDEGGCWSGCARIVDGRPAIYYTGVRGPAECGVESVCRAWGSPDLQSWTPDPHGPLIPGPPPGTEHQHRDPFVWRDRSGGDGWHLLVAGTTRADQPHGRLLRYDSADATAWEYGGVFFEGPRELDGIDLGVVWECAQLIDERVLVISCSLPDGEDPLWYCVAFVGAVRDGRFEGRLAGRLDHGDAFYAPMLCAGADPRQLLWAWAPEPLPAEVQAQLGHVGALTLPRELRSDDDGQVVCAPAAELAGLREGELSPEDAPGAQLELVATVAGERGCAGWTLHDTAGEPGARIAIDLDRGQLDVTARRPSGADPTFTAPLVGAGPYELRAFVDGSLLEVFVDDGRAAVTTRAYAAWSGARALCEGSAQVTGARAWALPGDVMLV